MKILFVYPEFPDTFWSFKHALKFIRKKASAPPLGLLTVASMLPTGWEKRLVDLNAESLKQKDLEWADMVFISAMVIQRESAHQVIRRCKEAGVTVVAGGPLFTQEHEQFPEVDHFVLNEAELTLPLFVADLALGRAQRVYTTREYPDIRLTPAPLWKLVNFKHYDTISIQFSRGCPYNCEFCNVTALFGHRPRTKTAAQIIAELDDLYATGWRRNVFFVDDNFIGNKKQLKEQVLPAQSLPAGHHPDHLRLPLSPGGGAAHSVKVCRGENSRTSWQLVPQSRTGSSGGDDLQIDACVIYQNLLILFADVFPITGGRQCIGDQGA